MKIGCGCLCKGILVQPFTDGLVKALFGKRFQQVVHCMRLESTDGVFVKSRSKDDCRWLFDQFQHFKSVDLGHLDIEEDKIGMVLLDGLDAFETIGTFLHGGYLRIGLEVFLYDQSRQWLVVNYNGFYHKCLLALLS